MQYPRDPFTVLRYIDCFNNGYALLLNGLAALTVVFILYKKIHKKR
jgi:hypothetical protein